jgi:nitrate/TMAO reductase-like tetraheme cytochrome c subunit
MDSLKTNAVRFFLLAIFAGSGAFSWAAEAAPAASAAQAESCVECHKDEKFRVQNKKIYDYYQEWKGSAHDLAGLSCTACHGGDATKAVKEEAHAGILPQSDPASPFNYKNIPNTCGRCHQAVLDRFVKSRHYEQLKTTGRGPNCITCHGALNARVYATTIIDRACSNCHNAKTKNHPEIIAKAQEILGRLDHANGYRKGLKFYYKSIKKPEAMIPVDKAYTDTIYFWHEFNFEKIGPRSQDLLAEIKKIYLEAHKGESSQDDGH